MDNSELEVVKLIPRNQGSDDIERLSAMLDKATCPIAYITQDYRYKYVNRAYAEWVGVDACDIIGKKIQDILGDAIFSALKDYMDAALRGKEVHYKEEIPYRSGTRMV